MRHGLGHPVVVLLAVAATIAFNGWAEAVRLYGTTIPELSARYDTLFTPAGWAFAIWEVIYAGLAAYALYQIRPGEWANPLLRRIAPAVVASSLLGIMWTALFHREELVASLGVILLYWGALLVVYTQLARVHSWHGHDLEHWLVSVPFRIYFGWLTVASLANLAIVLQDTWPGWGERPEQFTVGLVLAGLVATMMVSARWWDPWFAVTVAWAYAGIALKDEQSPTVMLVAGLAALLAVLFMAQTAIVGRHQRTARRRAVAK